MGGGAREGGSGPRGGGTGRFYTELETNRQIKTDGETERNRSGGREMDG